MTAHPPPPSASPSRTPATMRGRGLVGANSDGGAGDTHQRPVRLLGDLTPRTLCGLSGRPAISRAEARFSAGYSLSLTLTG